MLFIPHSIPVDGGNASISCLPTVHEQHKRRRRRDISLHLLFVCISLEMVHYCMVPGCSSRTRKGQALSFHRLPRDVERCKQWLRAIKHHKFGEETAMEALKKQKVCSLHFKPEDFNVPGFMQRAALLNTAIPSIFTFPEHDKQPGTISAEGICLEVRLTIIRTLAQSSAVKQHISYELYISWPSFACFCRMLF